ncbi:MAG: tetraacyldisaccharide 4'-kinase [Armatimonadetes bacterium]|nr:tetraacyldisaccharide 4'-kinase [Armatimonadota bacterium]
MDWERVWQAQTAADRLVSSALLPLSWLYESGWRAYLAAYQSGLKRRRRFEIPILGVGSLETGGLGKTPAAVAAANCLIRMGKRPAVSASGYGSPSARSAALIRPEDAATPDRHGDEACLIRAKVPEVGLIVGRDRVRAAVLAQEAGFDALVLDDGFQHLPLARSADLLLWNAGARNRRCLPAGPMREPASGWRRADAIAVPEESKGGAMPSKPAFLFRRVFPGLRRVQGGERAPLDWLRGRSVAALCAIARPRSFFDKLETLGARVERRVALRDHDPLRLTLDGGIPWIVTEKDAMKLACRGGLPADVYALEMDIQFCDEEAFIDWLTDRLFR